MKILKYKHYMLKEEIINFNTNGSNDITMEQVKQSMLQTIEQVRQFEETLSHMDDEDLEKFLEVIKEQPMPKILKDYFLTTMQLMRKKEFLNLYKEHLNTIMTKINEYTTPNELFEDLEIKENINQLMLLMSELLNKPTDEITELTNKLLGGIKEFQKSSEGARKITEEDPYGEETWDNMSDKERLYKAFGEEKPKD